MNLRPGDSPPIQLASGESHPDVYTGDTTHLDAIDCEGNMMAATPSGGWIPSSPVIEGLGFPLGTRGQMFYLNVKPRECTCAAQTPAHNTDPVSRNERWKTVYGFRNTRRRLSGSVDIAVFPQLRRLRYEICRKLLTRQIFTRGISRVHSIHTTPNPAALFLRGEFPIR